MKRSAALAIALAISLFLPAAETFARGGPRWQGSGGWGPGESYNRMYDPKSVENLTGEVTSVEQMTSLRGMSYGIQLMIKTDNETIPVHLGPGWFIENQDVKIVTGDKVQVKGSRILFDGKPAVIAAELARGDDVLRLRDENGFPMWSGWRRR